MLVSSELVESRRREEEGCGDDDDDDEEEDLKSTHMLERLAAFKAVREWKFVGESESEKHLNRTEKNYLTTKILNVAWKSGCPRQSFYNTIAVQWNL